MKENLQNKASKKNEDNTIKTNLAKTKSTLKTNEKVIRKEFANNNKTNTEDKENTNKTYHPLPKFSKSEELFSAITHIVGGAFAIVATIILMYFSIQKQHTVAIISSVIYGLSMIILFTASSIYHFLRENKAKRLFRIFDHCAIFLLIAGTYTPFCLITLGGTTIGLITLTLVWSLAVVGVTFNAINMHNKAVVVLSQISYIIMGWSIIISITPLLSVLHINGFWWLLAGGFYYTVGVLFFALGKKVKYFHSIWHFFVLAGAATQFISILYYVILPL